MGVWHIGVAIVWKYVSVQICKSVCVCGSAAGVQVRGVGYAAVTVCVWMCDLRVCQ